MPGFVMVKADGGGEAVNFSAVRSAVMFARRHNETAPPGDRIVDVLFEGRTVMFGAQRSKIDRIERYVNGKGYSLKRGRTHYVIESDCRKLYRLVPRLRILVRKELGGYVLTGEECIDFRKRKWVFRIVFD